VLATSSWEGKNLYEVGPGLYFVPAEPGYQLKIQLRTEIRKYPAAAVTYSDSQGHQHTMTSRSIQAYLTAAHAF
jgi:hypothetical protein